MKQALGFLTPIGGAATPTADALPWFPVVGALIGVAVGFTWWSASLWFPGPVAGAIAVVADLALTGMLHIDGVADAADGLLAPMSRERRLEVMRDPRTGAFGVCAVVAVLLLRYSVLASVSPGSLRAVLAIAALWCMSRTAMAVIAGALPYARNDGLASVFLGGRPGSTILVGLPLALVLGLLGTNPPLRGILAVAGCVIGAAVVSTLARTRLGGFTGDVLGAAGVIGETVGLLILAAHS